MADRILPPEQRGSRRDMVLLDGGLLSSTINAERSLGVDGKVVSCKGRFCAGGSVGFSSGEFLGGFSRKRESDKGDGAVRSSEDAAQSQRVDKAP